MMSSFPFLLKLRPTRVGSIDIGRRVSRARRLSLVSIDDGEVSHYLENRSLLKPGRVSESMVGTHLSVLPERKQRERGFDILGRQVSPGIQIRKVDRIW